MKKQLLIISIIVVIVSIFVSCSANSGIETISTTAVTDAQGTTHYYQPLTENESTSVYAEIVTDDKDKAVTNKNGTYVTKEYTTVLTTKATISVEKNSTTTQSSEISKTNPADNVVEFEPSETTEQTKPTTSTTTEKTTTTTTETTTQKETQPATDKDGWITKWY